MLITLSLTPRALAPTPTPPPAPPPPTNREHNNPTHSKRWFLNYFRFYSLVTKDDNSVNSTASSSTDSSCTRQDLIFAQQYSAGVCSFYVTVIVAGVLLAMCLGSTSSSSDIKWLLLNSKNRTKYRNFKVLLNPDRQTYMACLEYGLLFLSRHSLEQSAWPWRFTRTRFD